MLVPAKSARKVLIPDTLYAKYSKEMTYRQAVSRLPMHDPPRDVRNQNVKDRLVRRLLRGGKQEQELFAVVLF
jgi:hypothetical protein